MEEALWKVYRGSMSMSASRGTRFELLVGGLSWDTLTWEDSAGEGSLEVTADWV